MKQLNTIIGKWQSSTLPLLICLLILGVSQQACKKTEIVDIPVETLPYYDEVPTLIIENYINKLFIDLVGREPTDEELALERATFRASNLAVSSRDDLITKLQTDTTFIEGDGSFKRAYHHWFYESVKSHLVEGAAIDEINMLRNNAVDALNDLILAGDTLSNAYFAALLDVENYDRLISAEIDYFNGAIDILEVMRRMIFNGVYDKINMNSFNFVNATFDNLYFRFPTQEEYENAYRMVDSGEPASLFGQTGTNKSDYVAIIASNLEIYEGLIIWAYQSLLARNPTSEETSALINDFIATRDFKVIQKTIMRTDEYGRF